MILFRKTNAVVRSRFAITGDFLPASGLRLPEGTYWGDIAKGLASYFADVDTAILNLETCMDTEAHQPRPKLGLGDSFSASPEVLEFPLALGAKIIGMANNHIFDYGEECVAQTKRKILDRNLTPLGTGRSLSETPDVHVSETAAGLRIGFWSAARHLADLATRKRSGIEPATRKRGKAAIDELRAQGACITVAYLHAGMEHTNRPDPDDVSLMDDLARIGFDVVTACHSHRISGYKSIPRRHVRPAFCFYGLGSISSGVLYSDLEREGLVALFDLDATGEIVGAEVLPVYLEQSGWGRIPDMAGAQTILTRFLHLSREIADGRYRQTFYRDIRKNLFERQFRDFQAAIHNGGILGLVSKLGRMRMRHLNRIFHNSLG